MPFVYAVDCDVCAALGIVQKLMLPSVPLGNPPVRKMLTGVCKHFFFPSTWLAFGVLQDKIGSGIVWYVLILKIVSKLALMILSDPQLIPKHF